MDIKNSTEKDVKRSGTLGVLMTMIIIVGVVGSLILLLLYLFR
jgi:hypothetical protein